MVDYSPCFESPIALKISVVPQEPMSSTAKSRGEWKWNLVFPSVIGNAGHGGLDLVKGVQRVNDRFL